MAARKASAAIMDATAAAQAEGIFEPTAEQRADIARLRDLTARARAIESEADAIKDRLISQMDEVGAKALAVDGKNLVLIVSKKKDEFYSDQMAAAYPEIVATYVEAKAAYDEKAPEFTFKVDATPAKTFPGAR